MSPTLHSTPTDLPSFWLCISGYITTSKQTDNCLLPISTWKEGKLGLDMVKPAGGGGGGFFPHLRGFWENVWPFIPCQCFFFFFLVVEISLHTLIPLCMPGSVHSGSASWNNCLNVPDKLCVSTFPGKFPYYCLDSSIVSPLKLRWMKPTVAVTKAVAGEQLLLGVWVWASVTCYRCKVRNVAHSDTTYFLFFSRQASQRSFKRLKCFAISQSRQVQLSFLQYSPARIHTEIHSLFYIT